MGSVLVPQQQGHVVLFPFMSKGHTIPLLHLSRLFLLRGLAVTVITTPANRPFISLFLANTAASVVSIPFPHNISPDIPDGVESTDMLSAVSDRLFFPFALATRHMQPDFEAALASLSPRVSFLVSDSFLWWTLDSAAKLGLPRLAFYGLSNYAMSVSKLILEATQRLESDDESVPLAYFPRIKISKKDILPAFANPTPEASEFHINVVSAVENSLGLVINSFYELEPEFFEYWNTECGPKSWNVGPLCQLVAPKRAPSEENLKPFWVEWLEQKEKDGSGVLYVAFGTQAQISPEQIREIREGLEKSGVDFLWVIRKKEEIEKWDSEFEERVKGRGMVVNEWVDQTEILNHASVEGFLSHCGWSSVMEGVCAGVPILAWPMMADQPLNARMVAEEIKVGLRVMTCDDGKFVKAEGLEKMVRELMEGEKGAEARSRVKNLADVARKSVAEGGSSWRTLESMIDEVCKYAQARATEIVRVFDRIGQ